MLGKAHEYLPIRKLEGWVSLNSSGMGSWAQDERRCRMDDPISDGMNAAGNLLNTEPVKNLLSPVTKEVGLALGTIGSVVRFYCEDNLQKVFTKWARQRDNKPLQPAEFVRVIPLLQAASLVSDDDLQERWAALLESSVSGPDGVLPSFGQTLSQLTAEEAKFLDTLVPNQEHRARDRALYGGPELRYDELGNIHHLEELYNPLWQHLSYPTRNQFDSEIETFHLMVGDLERLGLIEARQKLENISEDFMSLDDVDRLLRQLAKRRVDDIYYITKYGFSFIEAVTPNP